VDAAQPEDVTHVGKKRTTDIFQRLKRYAPSVLPFGLGAAVTLKYGIDEVREGKKKDGWVDVARGSGGILDNANLAIYLNGFHLMHVAAPVLTAAGFLGALSMFTTAPLDGGRDLIQGLHQHNTKLAAIGAVKLGAVGLSVAGSLTHLPLFLAAGTVVGMGALIYQNRAAIKAVPGKVAHLAHEVKEHVVHHRDGQDDANSGALATAN
jgi:hypothetical protein